MKVASCHGGWSIQGRIWRESSRLDQCFDRDIAARFPLLHRDYYHHRGGNIVTDRHVPLVLFFRHSSCVDVVSTLVVVVWYDKHCMGSSDGATVVLLVAPDGDPLGMTPLWLPTPPVHPMSRCHELSQRRGGGGGSRHESRHGTTLSDGGVRMGPSTMNHCCLWVVGVIVCALKKGSCSSSSSRRRRGETCVLQFSDYCLSLSSSGEWELHDKEELTSSSWKIRYEWRPHPRRQYAMECFVLFSFERSGRYGGKFPLGLGSS